MGLVEVPQEEAATYSLAYVGGLPGGFGGTQRALHFTPPHAVCHLLASTVCSDTIVNATGCSSDHRPRDIRLGWLEWIFDLKITSRIATHGYGYG